MRVHRGQGGDGDREEGERLALMDSAGRNSGLMVVCHGESVVGIWCVGKGVIRRQKRRMHPRRKNRGVLVEDANGGGDVLLLGLGDLVLLH